MKLDWKQGILYLAVMGMEVCWLYVLIALLNNKAAGDHLSVAGILALYPASFFFNRLLGRLRWPGACILGASLLGWIMCILLIVKMQLYADTPLSESAWLLSIPQSIAQVIYILKPEFIILLSTGIIWWLGQRLASRDVSFPIMLRKFQFGLIILVLTFFTGSKLDAIPDNTIPVALIFFLFALFGISVAHTFKNTSWLSGQNRWPWSGLLLISISLILLLGLLITFLVTPELLQLLMTVFKWAWGLTCRLILKVIEFLVGLFPQSEPGKLPPVLSMPPTNPEQGKPLAIPKWVRSSLLFTISVFCTGMVLLALYRVTSDVFYRLRRKLADMADAEFEPMSGALKTDLLSVLKLLLSRLVKLLFFFRLRHKGGAVSPDVVSIRRIYRQLLHWAARCGCPRHISQTPYEYCRTLESLLPDAGSDLNFITQQYVMARYGVLLSSKDTLNILSQAWHRIKQTRLKRASVELSSGKEGNQREQNGFGNKT